jgi:hypothetical protein
MIVHQGYLHRVRTGEDHDAVRLRELKLDGGGKQATFECGRQAPERSRHR